MPWLLKMEFSGITLIRLARDTAGAYAGTALFSPGLNNKHTPFLYVPMEGLRNPASFATPEAIAAFGLRTIAAPDGRYLLEVALDGAEVDLQNQGVTPRGPIVFAKTSYTGRPSILPVDWHDLLNSVDIRALAQKFDPNRTVDASRARGRVFLPAGRLIGMPFVKASERESPYDISVTEQSGATATVLKQFASDRQVLVAESTSDVIITVNKPGTPALDLTFGPKEGEAARSVVFSSNCAAGTGEPDELTEYVPLLTPQGVTFTMAPMGATDDHPCITGIWIEP